MPMTGEIATRQQEALEKIGKHTVIKQHDDGDLTIKDANGCLHVITTEGETFTEQSCECLNAMSKVEAACLVSALPIYDIPATKPKPSLPKGFEWGWSRRNPIVAVMVLKDENVPASLWGKIFTSDEDLAKHDLKIVHHALGTFLKYKDKVVRKELIHQSDDKARLSTLIKSLPQEVLPEVSRTEQPAAPKASVSSYGSPITKVTEDLIAELRWRAKYKPDNLPHELRYKKDSAIVKYVEGMGDSLARDWHSGIFTTGTGRVHIAKPSRRAFAPIEFICIAEGKITEPEKAKPVTDLVCHAEVKLAEPKPVRIFVPVKRMTCEVVKSK